MPTDLIRFLRLLGPYRRYACGILALAVLVTVTYRLEPLFLLVFVNEVTLKTNLNLLLALVAGMVACAVAAYYFYGVAKYHRFRLGQKLLADVRRALFARLLEQPPPFFEANPPGKLVALATAEVDALDAVTEAFFWGLQTLFAIAWIFAICFAIDRTLALLLFVPLPVLGLLLAVDGRMRTRSAVALDRQSRLVSFLKQRLSNVATTQAFQRERADAGRLGAVADDLVEARARTEVLAQVSQRLFELSHVLVLATILLVGGMRFVRHEGLSLGAVTAVFAYANGLFVEVTAMYGYIVRARLATAALRRVHTILDVVPPIRDDGNAMELGRASGHIELDRVSFKYPTSLEWALRDVSFDVKPGELVAVVGLSGSGKSTLFRLLMRFNDPTSGGIRLDGHDLRSIRLASLRAQLGLATQDAVLFEGTVGENIGYGREGASQDEIVAAARAAVAEAFIARTPKGFETLIGEGGIELSGGERQRIALARVIVKGAPVLLMDEVTAGLDSKTEGELQEALAAITRQRTTIVIAHRLATVLRADRILVMESGRIVQRGTHAELHAQKNGLYRFLFDRQFAEPLARASLPQPIVLEARAAT